MDIERIGASAVIIGNEVLSAKVRDENGPLLLQRLSEKGVPMRWMAVVPDEVDAIVEALLLARKKARVVFTSGGIWTGIEFGGPATLFNAPGTSFIGSEIALVRCQRARDAFATAPESNQGDLSLFACRRPRCATSGQAWAMRMRQRRSAIELHRSA